MTPNEQPDKSPPPEMGERLTLDELLELADVDAADLDEAIVWWDEHASETFKGVLD